MEYKSSKEIRQMWIDFFVSKGHLFVESKSLIPYKDPSLLWINSGVATLKDYFSGKKQPPSKRLTNSQKSIRTNDIENVGVTARHHTFFEMLGNFSIGDYFKKEAIEFADELLTQVFKFEREKLYITYFEEDIQVRDKWISLGYDPSHLIPGSRELNFWDVGSGPCGPNTEIFYDRGEKYHKGGPELIANDIENDRFIEIWNIVFSEFNNLGENKYEELSQKNIDTGAGLERIVSIFQDGPTNFDTDLFLPIIHKVEELSKSKYEIDNYFKNDKEQSIVNKHFKIIADHMRAIVNAISDGEKPSNTQRGYIIRRLIRRAYYSGKKLGIKSQTFLCDLVSVVVDSLIFEVDIEKVSTIIKQEEIAFSKTIDQGRKILEDEMARTKEKKFNVDVAFKLYETFGFPIEMTNDILVENDLLLDFEQLQKLKENHSQKSKSSTDVISFSKAINSLSLIKDKVSTFIGYDHLEYSNAKILYLLDSEKEISKTDNNESIAYVVLDKTPFYATSGGQAHDQGYFIQKGNKIHILDVFKDKFNNHIHVVQGLIDKNLPIDCFVDSKIRLGLMRNHSATHLSFAALRKVFGEEIKQLGSDNNQNRLTFDFALDHKPTSQEIIEIENFVNDVIKQGVTRNYVETTIDNAKKMGAIMTIEETEYFDSNNVRVVEFPNITVDLCGGTHIDNSRNLETYKIISIESKGTGLYRLRAITSFEIVSKYLKEEIEKKQQIFNSIYSKYENLYQTKQTSREFISNVISVDSTNLDEYLNAIIHQTDLISNEIKILLKEKSKINDNYQLNDFNKENTKVIFINNVDKSSIKDIAINQREQNKDALIIASSTFENGKSMCIFTSKSINVLEFIQNNYDQLQLKGGGNNLIWQGVSSEELSLEKLK